MAVTAPLKTAIIYTRISDARAALAKRGVDLSGLSKAEKKELMERGVDRQTNECEAVAERGGYQVVAKFKENDLSAYKPNIVRPQFERTLEMVRNNQAEVIVVWHLDRYMRRSAQLARLIDAAERGVEIVGATSGHVDLSTASGRMIARSLVAVSEYESEHHAERRTLANVDRAKRGEWQTANRPFGYTLDGHPLEPEATALRTAVADVLAGKSIRSIARQWNEAGLTTTRGNKFDGPRLRDILEKPRYAALCVHQGKIVGPGTWTPLITEDTHHALMTLLKDPARRTNGRVSFDHKHLGSGLYVCGVCHGKMQSKGGGVNIALTYRCRASTHLSRKAEPLDEWVTGAILEWFTRENCHRLIGGAVDMTELSTQRLAVQGKLKKLGAMYAADAIGDDEFTSAAADLRARLSTVDGQLLAATNTSPAATLITASQTARAAQEDVYAAVYEAWSAMSVTQRGAAIDEVAIVTVLPANKLGPGFDPNCVDITERHATAKVA